MEKSDLIKHCNLWWLLCKLGNEEKWPVNGTLQYNNRLPLIFFLRRENKWDKTKPEWQRGCGITLPPQGPLILALEKDRGKTKMRRCCCAGSEGQRCLKLRDREEEDSEIDI